MDYLRNKKHRKILFGVAAVIMCTIAVLAAVITSRETIKNRIFVDIESEDVPLSDGLGSLVEKTAADERVIPDKYNTGCSGNLTKVEGAGTYSNVVFRFSGNIIILDFFYANKELSGDIVIENLDFSKYDFTVNSEHKALAEKYNVTFKNCKFLKATTGEDCPDKFKYTFNNCTFKQFQGSNATFNRCQFGRSYRDCLNPFKNVYVNDSFFLDLATTEPEGAGMHSDGVQIYARKEIAAENIVFDNCRFEIPAVQPVGDTTRVNCCVGVALEYNDGTNIHINNCIVNGGGYTLYSTRKNEKITLTNISFNNIKVGGAKLFGTLYPNIAPGVSFNNVVDQDALYVSSVWQDSKGTHIIVTNDTLIERTLKVITDKGEYEFEIPACLGGHDLRFDNFGMKYEEFPFDMDKTVPSDVRYIVCYDATDFEEKQIRSMAFDGEPIYVAKTDKKTEDMLTRSAVLPVYEEVTMSYMEMSGAAPTLEEDSGFLEGTCGDSATFILDDQGLLKIKGSGAMKDYDSSKPAPWADKASEIKSLEISEGITYIGSQAFRKLTGITSVVIPSSVTGIGSNAFIGCSSLQSLELYKNLTNIGRYAFSGTALNNVRYHGYTSEWGMVSIADHNEPLVNCTVTVDEEPVTEEPEPAEENNILLSGDCGGSVCFELTNDGILNISGNGAMTDYDSSKPAPWYDVKDSINEVNIGEGVTSVGSQSFRKCANLSSVQLPSTLTVIGSNSFIGCGALNEITIGANVTEIQRYAFSGTGLSAAYYEGNADAWSNVAVGDHNDELINCLDFE